MYVFFFKGICNKYILFNKLYTLKNANIIKFVLIINLKQRCTTHGLRAKVSPPTPYNSNASDSSGATAPIHKPQIMDLFVFVAHRL